jgi:hypothetical protein
MTPAEDAIDRLLAMFGEPRTTSPERFLAEYQKALTGIEGEILDLAVDRVMKTATFWPKPAELLEEVNRIAADKYRHRSVDWDAVEADRKAGWQFSDLQKASPTPEARAEAQRLVDEMKRNIAANKLDEQDPLAPHWKRAQRGGHWKADA